MSGKSHKTPKSNDAAPEVAPAESTVSNSDQLNLMYQNNYEGFYGSRLGEPAWGLVEDNLNPEKIDGYARDAFGSAGSYIGDLAVEHADEGELAQAQALRKHLEGSFSQGFGDRFAGSNISEGIYDFVGENPWSLLAGGALGLGAAYAADVDLDFDTDIGLGKNWDLMLGGDFGSAQDIGMDAARTGLEYSNDRTKLGVEGEYRFDNGDYSAGLYGQHRNTLGGLWRGNLDYAHTGETNTTSGALSYHQPGSFWAGMNGSHVAGPEGSTSALNGMIRSDFGESNPWSLEAGAGWHSDNGVNAYGKARYNPSENFSFDAGVSHDEQNGTAANVGLSYRF